MFSTKQIAEMAEGYRKTLQQFSKCKIGSCVCDSRGSSERRVVTHYDGTIGICGCLCHPETLTDIDDAMTRVRSEEATKRPPGNGAQSQTKGDSK